MRTLNKILLPCLLLSNIHASDVSDPGQFSDPLFHKNKGCPINSICSEEMGLKIKEWETFLKSLNEKNKVKKLSEYKTKHGLPLEFLGRKSLEENIKPVMWNSHCKLHNPRNPNNNIYRSMQFLKSIPKNDELVFKTIELYDGTEIVKYRIPHNSHPVLIKNNKLVMTQDYDDFYYQLSVDKDGLIGIENLPYSFVSKAIDKNVRDTKCPKEMSFNSEYFAKTYCHKIYDLDADKLKTIQTVWSCP